MPEMTLQQLAERIGGCLEGEPTQIVRGLGPLEHAAEDQAGFLANSRYEKHMATTRAAAVIVARDYKPTAQVQVALIRCEDPYFAYRQAMVAFYGFRSPEFEGIDARAAVHESAKLGESVCIGALAVVADGCEVGDNTVIYPGAYVGPRCRVGRDCTIYPNVTLYDGSVLHDRVTIHAGTTIGHDGFGYATHAGEDGVVRHEKIPQAGWVEIEDDVEIGGCCAIDRATMGPTIIGAGSKFSNLVAIGHGTRMGKHCLMVAQAGIAGSVTVGDYCVFAGQCGVVGHIRIGSGVKVGAKAGVVNDIEPGLEVLGSPAIPLAEARRAIIASSRLPEMRNELRRLTREVKALRKRLDDVQDTKKPPERDP
jgi:UDP-3-O-[3-hydroxymyristoyl] glucosamine N-acyltransferase